MSSLSNERVPQCDKVKAIILLCLKFSQINLQLVAAAEKTKTADTTNGMPLADSIINNQITTNDYVI
jgi:hypothetical protein